MKFNPIPLLTALLWLSFSSSAQTDPKFDILLRNGVISPDKNITPDKINDVNAKLPKIAGRSFLIIQFEKIPTTSDRKKLQESGIDLLDYVPNNSYTVTVAGPLNTVLLGQVKARAVIALTAEQKMQSSLFKGVYPVWAVKVGGTVDVWISFPKTFLFESVVAELNARNIDVVSSMYKEYRVIALRISTSRLTELALLPFIEYVQAAPKEDQPINDKSRANARANVLNSTLPGHRNLHGEGIVIGIGDNANPLQHVDFTNRIINRSAAPGGSHGVHVMGTAAGAGIIQERYTGIAPKSVILKQVFGGILVNAPAYVQDHGMVISNNSYGIVEDDCTSFGFYDLYSRIMDQQASQLPNLQTVFATGNSGGYLCGPWLNGFGTVLGSYQSAKNVLNVGAVTELGVIAGFSSKGPVRDGRLKPEITALGTPVYSTWSVNIYSPNQGTSMAAPAVSGGLALLYQRYKQLNSNNNPKNGLMKALLCNGATDIGNPGPDYSYGFGGMNLLRSVQMMENTNYVNDSVATSDSDAHSIIVPANTAQLKVMLYWNDPAAAILASRALVNDLDLEVKDPSLVTTLPKLLDTSYLNVNNVAITGIDRINNIEQVVIDNPAAGTYIVSVKGTAVTQNPRQEYFMVYDAVPVSTTITYPIGGERFKEGDSVNISWDSYGNTSNDFTIQRSLNGEPFSNLPGGANIASSLRQFKWFVDTIATTKARVKIIHNGTGIESISDTFTIIGVPIDSLLASQCEGYISLGWRTVTGATDYQVMMLRGDEMVPVATTTANFYHFSGLSKDSVYWVSVRARINGVPGRRAYAVSRQPSASGSCSGTFTANDLKIDALLAPVSGRVLTSSALTATTLISARIKNLDNTNSINNFNVKYSVNGAAYVSEPAAGPIAANGLYTHNFTALYDFSSIGSYVLKVVVENTSAADPVGINDTVTVIIKQLPNVAITLVTGTDFLDDLETAADSSYYRGQIGLAGADRYDFTSSTVYGRVRTFVNSGIARSGNKALTLDADRFNAGGTADSLKATFNLLPHFNNLDDIRLDFAYKNHVQGPDNANKVWIRGDDAKPWIEVYDLYANQNEPGSFKKSSSIELSDILMAGGQDFSTSFQVRFGQWGHIITADNDGGAGYTFDDIHLYKVDNDIQMIRIDTPVLASCGLSSTVPVRVIVRNSADTAVNNIPVSFSIDGTPAVTEIIPAIAGNTNISYTFTATADLSAIGTHIVKAWVDYAGDSFRENDTVTVTVINSPVVSTFPYLENFEAGNGSWYTSGKNNSWEYGTPASNKISRAASGSKAWKTNLTGSYKDQQLSYLYSPCYDLTGMAHPTLSLSIALDLEDCGSGSGDLCDGAYMEYSADGVNWSRLGANGQGTNWYDKTYPNNNLWSTENYTNWHVASISLPVGYDRLRLRFVITSDPFVNREGIAVDDIHIYDSVYSIYSGSPYVSNTINQASVSGNNWIDFTDGGKLIASLNPNGQNMGSTNARVFINTSAVRTNNSQYYHDRNITIKPANNNLADSATVRFYFLDTETENLINATGCPTCTKPSMAYELGVSKYRDADTSKENGTLDDNALGSYLFIQSEKVNKIPYLNGYYAEFKVKDFSEFWLNNGGLNNNQALPVELLSFSAKKTTNKKDVLAEWSTASEVNADRFELELAKGNEEFRQNRFVKIAEINSQGNSTTEQHYSFTDMESSKAGARYYRLKLVDLDGRFSYSAVRPVVFNDEIRWQVYPNPSQGIFNLIYQVNEGENVEIKLYDISGKLVHQSRLVANGFVQKHSISLQSNQFASGLYLLEAAAGEKKELFRLIKQ